MKKTLLLMLLLLSGLTASAQFEQGKKYINTSFSSLGLSYSGSEKFRLGVEANAGYFVADCLLLRANVGYDHTKKVDDVSVGAGARYYFDQCGVYLGAGAEFDHYTKASNDVMIPVEVGYAFFVNRFITIEPSVYYKMSLHDFSDNSTVGFRLGLGFYF
jgi:opacity protein-like surface antigen